MIELLKRNTCRLCAGKDLVIALHLKPSPIADAYVSREQLDVRQDCFPLDLFLCLDCGHVQHLSVIDPDTLFRGYTYKTSISSGLVDHYDNLVSQLIRDYSLDATSFVLEIGSNDGTLLNFLRQNNIRVLGVDPARDITRFANESGAPTIPEFFTHDLAKSIKKEHGAVTVVIANNVFAHADDLSDIVKGIYTLLEDDAIFVFEVSYLLDIIDIFLFDTVYHEHVSYHSIVPLNAFFKRHGMQLFNIERIGSKGGSIRCYVQKVSSGKHKVNPIVQQMESVEHKRGLLDKDIFVNFGHAIEQRKQKLLDFITSEIKDNKKLTGYGASTTVTTLIYHFELMEYIDFLVDDNPVKQNTFSPGCHIPVVSADELYSRKPDYILILAWQYAGVIIKNNQEYLENGGKFLIPLPDFRIISHHNYKSSF